MNFRAWLREVDEYVNLLVGCSLHDLEDYMWRDLYDDEFEPQEAAETAIEDMGLFMREGDPGFYDYMAYSDADPGL